MSLSREVPVVGPEVGDVALLVLWVAAVLLAGADVVGVPAGPAVDAAVVALAGVVIGCWQTWRISPARSSSRRSSWSCSRVPWGTVEKVNFQPSARLGESCGGATVSGQGASSSVNVFCNYIQLYERQVIWLVIITVSWNYIQLYERQVTWLVTITVSHGSTLYYP